MEGKQDELFTGPTLQKIEDMMNMRILYSSSSQNPKSLRWQPT